VNVQLRAVRKSSDELVCTVEVGGTVSDRKGINLPDSHVSSPALTDKDRGDLEWAIAHDVEYVALSFVRRPENLTELRELICSKGGNVRIVSKIEKPEAVGCLGPIIEQSDVVLVARGDLGVEMDVSRVPLIQKEICLLCRRAGKPVIVATQMLQSMVESPVPTRAEVSDVANAVFEQADAIMLSGETSTGRYPLECVETLDRIARRIEASGGAGYADHALLPDEKQITCKSAVVLANELPDSLLVVFTKRGLMARYLSQLRPESPIFALITDPKVCRSLALCRGVEPIRFDISPDTEQTINNAATYLKAKGLAKAGEHLVIVSDMFQQEAVVDSILLRKA